MKGKFIDRSNIVKFKILKIFKSFTNIYYTRFKNFDNKLYKKFIMNDLVIHNKTYNITEENKNTNLATTWIAFEVFGEKWLINSQETKNFIPLNEITNGADKGYIERIPLTKKWFLGVCSYKGKIFAVSDINLFINEYLLDNNTNTDTDNNTNNKTKNNAYLILLQAENQYNIDNAGIVIYKSLGLKNSTSLSLNFLENNSETSNKNTWHQQATDKDNNLWNILSIKELLNDEKFFNINTFTF